MAKLNIPRTRDLLQSFDFKVLFSDELGWSRPALRKAVAFQIGSQDFNCVEVAELSGVVVFEVHLPDGTIPDAKTRAAVHKEVAKQYHENLLIFVDRLRTQSLWYWVKREERKSYPREHSYFRGQPGDLFLSKLSSMVIDISELDEAGQMPIVEVAMRLKKALDVERVTKKFYVEFQREHIAFLNLIDGIEDERDRRWYASIMLNRLMFIYFLQKKEFINNRDAEYLQKKLAESRQRGPDRYYSEFLKLLFFEGFAKPEHERSERAAALLGDVKYLNGGLFLEHRIETDWPGIRIPDKAFDNLFRLFGDYTWNLNDTPGGNDDELNPDVLGYIFEKYINQKAFGAYYTRTEITGYLCERTIHRLILDRVNNQGVPGLRPSRRFESIAELLMNLDAALCRGLVTQILPDLRVLDPACGSGAFLVAAMKTLIGIYSAVIGRIKFLSDSYLSKWLRDIERDHEPAYFIKKAIITDNLFGVDVMEEAVEIAKLRLFLALVASAETVDQLDPLPNIDFNIVAGNSLVGLMQIGDHEFDRRQAQGHLFVKPYREVLAEKNRLIDNYRHTATYADDLRELRDSIERKKREALGTLNDILLDSFVRLGIRFEEATWDEAKSKEGRPKKRALTIDDIEALRPLHWGYEFDEILNARAGFDIIITNPPWEVFQAYEKEFFQYYIPTIQKNKLAIEDWRKDRGGLMQDPAIRRAWLDYASGFSYVARYLKGSPQYRNQISTVNNRNVGSKINLYSYFLEQCYNLLRPDGECGIVIPSGIYTDLSTKQLRELLFSSSEITGLLGFENRRTIFENVDSRFKFVVLTFRKGGKTEAFPVAFMRQDVGELEDFPRQGALHIPVELIRQLSPESLSLMEFKDLVDVTIAQKMLPFPAIGDNIEGSWNVLLMQEFNMTTDSDLFLNRPTSGAFPLVQGGMIHQFRDEFAPAKYWLDSRRGRARILGKAEDKEQQLSYQTYRLAHRRIARNTDTRTLIACVLPPNRFCADTAQTTRNILSPEIALYVTGILNSFVLDYSLRQRVTTHVDMHFLYALRMPRLSTTDPRIGPIVRRVAHLTCTEDEFDDLARQVGERQRGTLDEGERARLRAELDGLIAHLYGLTEEEFRHILSTFPLVPEPVKVAALNAYRDFAPSPGDPEIGMLISRGESVELEFKSSARWDLRADKPNKAMEDVVVKTVAAFLNSERGGNLLIGVDDDGGVIGLAHDYRMFGKRNSRDAYENFLTTLLTNAFGKDASAFFDITFHDMAGSDVVKIAVLPARRPAFVRDERGEHLYIRAGNSTRVLTTREAIEYSRNRWPA